jgi:hypothetical protein
VAPEVVAESELQQAVLPPVLLAAVVEREQVAAAEAAEAAVGVAVRQLHRQHRRTFNVRNRICYTLPT